MRDVYRSTAPRFDKEPLMTPACAPMAAAVTGVILGAAAILLEASGHNSLIVMIAALACLTLALLKARE